VILTPPQFLEMFGRSVPAVDDRILFMECGARTVESLDYLGTPGADITCDLNVPLEKQELYGSFDCVLDGGTCEHVFNTGTCFASIAKLVKNGGTVIHVNPCQGYFNHGFYSFQPTLYFDFYGSNGFTCCEAYLFEFTEPDYYRYPGRARIVALRPDAKLDFRSANNTLIIFKARKNVEVSTVTFPMQSIYRNRSSG
jgi:hypothetical protein